jgi:hypothetical protein
MKTHIAPLIGRIHQALNDLERVVVRTRLLLDKAIKTDDDGYLDGVALNLHGFYAGVERIFEDIGRTLERSLPEGATWHQDLLLQMSAEIPSVRPAVISLNTRYCLDEYRGFRHVVRNIYTFNLRGSRMRELAKELPACYVALQDELGKFINFLEQLSKNH